ncbi:MAG: aquaporin [Planctomycetia bacterium]|nr:aquaporin [Planctomycetia bacterium]
MDKLLRPCIAELVGVFALVFVTGGTICMSQLADKPGQPQPYALGVALAQGFIFAAMLAATVRVSGGFLNPAVTVTLWVFKRIELQRACWLIGAQLLGGLLAAVALHLAFTEDVLLHAHGGTPHLNIEAFSASAPRFTYVRALLSGIGIEFVLTFLLTFVIYGALLDPRAPQTGALGPGLAIAALTLLAYPLTGAAFNPARWLGPAIVEQAKLSSQAFQDHPIYWVGPFFGALAAGGLYEYLIWPEADTGKPPAVESQAPGEGPVTATLYKKKK